MIHPLSDESFLSRLNAGGRTMTRKRFGAEQMIGGLKEREAG